MVDIFEDRATQRPKMWLSSMAICADMDIFLQVTLKRLAFSSKVSVEGGNS